MGHTLEINSSQLIGTFISDVVWRNLGKKFNRDEMQLLFK